MNSYPNLVLLCLACHRWTEQEPKAAAADGYRLHTPEDGQYVPLKVGHRYSRVRYVRLLFRGQREDLNDADTAYAERYGRIPRKVEEHGEEEHHTEVGRGNTAEGE